MELVVPRNPDRSRWRGKRRPGTRSLRVTTGRNDHWWRGCDHSDKKKESLMKSLYSLLSYDPVSPAVKETKETGETRPAALIWYNFCISFPHSFGSFVTSFVATGWSGDSDEEEPIRRERIVSFPHLVVSSRSPSLSSLIPSGHLQEWFAPPRPTKPKESVPFCYHSAPSGGAYITLYLCFNSFLILQLP